MVHFEKIISEDFKPAPQIVWFQKYPYPTTKGIGNSEEAQEISEGNGVKNDFPRGLNSNSVRNLLLTDLVDHF